MYQSFFLIFLNAACFGPHMQIKICQSRLYHVCLTADAIIRFNQVKDVQMARWRRNYRTKISLVQFVHKEIHYITIWQYILQFTRPYFYFRGSWKNILMRVSEFSSLNGAGTFCWHPLQCILDCMTTEKISQLAKDEKAIGNWYLKNILLTAENFSWQLTSDKCSVFGISIVAGSFKGLYPSTVTPKMNVLIYNHLMMTKIWSKAIGYVSKCSFSEFSLFCILLLKRSVVPSIFILS